MSWILDIIIILIIGLTVYFAAKNGFVKTAVSAVSFILAILITLMFTSPLAETLKETSIAESIRETTEQKISDIILEGSYSISDLANGASEDFNTMIKLAGFDNEDIQDLVAETVVDALTRPAKDAAQMFASTIASHIAEPIIDLIATLVAVVILFFGSQLLLWIVSLVLNIIAMLPVLKTFNKAGGILIGVVLAFIRVCLFCFIFDILIENSAFLDIDLISSLNPDKTLLFSIFHNIDIFNFFIS